MSYVYYALLAALAFAATGLINKYSSKHSIDNKDSLMFFFMMGAPIFVLLLFPFVSKQIPSIEALTPVILANITFLIGYYLFYGGIFTVDASVFAPLFYIQSLIIGVLAYIFLGEIFPAANYVWGGLLILGAFLVSVDEKLSISSFIKPGILLIIAMQFFHAISNIYIGLALEHLNSLHIMFWTNVIITLFILPFYLLRRPKYEYSHKKIAPVIIVGIIGNLGALALYTAFKQNVTLSHIISMQSTSIIFIITIIASKFYPKLLEHHSRKVYIIRGLGLILTLLGAYKIATG